MQAIEHPPYSARRLTSTVRENAVVLEPELIFIKPLPNRIFFDMQDELGFDILKGDSVGLDDRRDAVTT